MDDVDSVIKSSLHNKWWKLVESGVKTFEGRVLIPETKWVTLSNNFDPVNSKIIFRNTLTGENSKIYNIINIFNFSSFDEMFNILGQKLLPGETDTHIYNPIYGNDDITYGVIALELE